MSNIVLSTGGQIVKNSHDFYLYGSLSVKEKSDITEIITHKCVIVLHREAKH